MEQLNWLNSAKGLFPYRWSLYSGGHANLDLTKQDWSEDMVRNREPGTFILGDSGGFQIAKGLWEGDWKANSGCPKAQKKREQVLAWLDGIANYGMILDIPTWVIHDKKASKACQITTLQEAVDAGQPRWPAGPVDRGARTRCGCHADCGPGTPPPE